MYTLPCYFRACTSAEGAAKNSGVYPRVCALYSFLPSSRARSVLLARAQQAGAGPCPTCEAASEEPRRPRAALRYVDGSMSTALRPLGFCLALNGRRGGPKVRRLRRLPCPTCVSSWQRKWQHGRAPSRRHVRKRWHGGAPSNLLQALMSHSAQSVFRIIAERCSCNVQSMICGSVCPRRAACA